MPQRWQLLPYLARRELARRFAGSLLGWVWAVLYPALQVSIYWAVFVLGLNLRSSATASFGAMLIAGIVPWFAISEGLGAVTASISANSQLVKRLVFPIEVLPSASLLATLVVHAFIVVLAIALLWMMGHPPVPYLPLIVYFTACMAIFVFATGMLLALANVAFRDVTQLLGSGLLLWFWSTPIVWPDSVLPARLQWLAEINPVNYLVQGYRLAFLGIHASSLNVNAAAAFWIETIILSSLAFLAFRRFKRELSDLL